VAVGSAALVLGMPAAADAHSTETTANATVRHVAGDGAADVGLIGDSTLSGVRWFGDYGDLERFNLVLDAESCRRTIERSCWSREQYRPRNALTALQEEEGEWGEVLVMMSGYNDSSDGFADGVEAIVEEARRQGIGAVVWLSLRTKGVDYEEPLHLANGSTYRDANRSLYALAEEFDGYLQVADWATHSAESPEWFEADGAHLAEAGAAALTGFIGSQLDVVLSGGTITPDPPPWEEVREGDEGDVVAGVQQALIDGGFAGEVIADGIYGPQTANAVAELQRAEGLAVTGVVDGATAAALGLYTPGPAVVTTADASTSTSIPQTTSSAALDASKTRREADGRSGTPSIAWLWALGLLPGMIWVTRRTSKHVDGVVERPVTSVVDSEPRRPSAALYDHELEAVWATPNPVPVGRSSDGAT
jgi:peptidoglycan hydrolase-like protein with peptidoglycan-binding domain